MKCEVESVQLVGTTYFTKDRLDEIKNENEQNALEYLNDIMKLSGKDDSMEDDEFVCGICQISFSRHCCHCTVPTKIDVDINNTIHRKEIFPRQFINLIANVHNGCSLAQGMCGHYFHYHCIEKWLVVPDAAGKCPMCRQDFVEYDK